MHNLNTHMMAYYLSLTGSWCGTNKPKDRLHCPYEEKLLPGNYPSTWARNI